MPLQARIESVITTVTGEAASISASLPQHGGSINDSRIIHLDDGRQFFVKTNRDAARYPHMFALEYEALQLLSAPGVIRIPRPLGFDDDFIVMEAFNAGSRKADWPELLGRRLALLHQATQGDRFGFERNNYLGTSSQDNTWSQSWLLFWRERRLGRQLGMYAQQASADDRLLKLGDRLMDRLDELLGPVAEPAVLLHGDLWSGNAAADDSGEPVIFDPACYYGQREAEIGMMRMFGGFGPRCEAAYEEVWPFAPGSEQRFALYRLYHELNHLNLFGTSYYSSCMATIESLL